MTKSLGQKIRDWRMKKGITQTELAEGLVTPSMISQIESDKANPSFKLLEGISRKLEVPIDEFLLDMQQELEADTRYKLAKSLMESKEYAKAIQVLEGLTGETEADKEEIKLELSEAYIFAKEYEKATNLLEGMLEEVAIDKDRSKSVELLRRLGFAKIQQHDFVLAKHYLGQAIKELSRASEVPLDQQGRLFHNFAIAMTHIGEVAESLQFYKQAINAYQGTSNLLLLGQGYMGLANTFYRLGNYKEASETTRTAITMFRSVNAKGLELTAKKNYAIFQYELENYDEALALLEECADEFRITGDNELLANVYGEIGTVYFRMEKYQEAEKWAFRALELLPSNDKERAYIHRTLGIMYEKLQNFERALEYTLNSVEIFENFGLISEATKCYALLVSIYQSRGELDKASDYMQKMTSSMEEGLRARGLYL